MKSNKISIISIENEAVIDALSYKANGLNRSDKVDTRKERLKKILRAGLKQEITDRQRDCLTKRYLENMSVNDIADCMNIRPAAVYKHIERAKKKIARLYKLSLIDDNDIDESISKKKLPEKIMRFGIEQELTEKQRKCFLKRYSQNMSVKDIANKMGVTPASVYKHIRKAKKRIEMLYNYL